jgi:hypothetical protein
MQAILTTQPDDFEKGPIFYNQVFGLLGTGVFNSDGRYHCHRPMSVMLNFSSQCRRNVEVCDVHLPGSKQKVLTCRPAGSIAA